MAYRLPFIAAGTFGVALLLAGCLDSKSTKDGLVSVDDAKTADVPSKLSRKILGDKSDAKDDSKKKTAGAGGNGGNYMMGPLENELERLKTQAAADRTKLTQVRSQSDELVRQTKETEESLRKAEEKIAKVQRVIGMLNEDPNALDNNSSLKKELASTVPGIGEAGPLGDGMPSLGQNGSAPQTSPLTGGPATGIDSPDSSLPRNGINVQPAPARKKDAPLTQPSTKEFSAPKSAPAAGSLAPLSAAPSFGEGPELKETSLNGVWAERNVPSAPADGKILVLEGAGPGMMVMIDRGSKDGITEGMLYEVKGAGGEKNILVVTKVYETNSITKVHRQYNGAGLQEGLPLKKASSAD